MRRFAPRSGRVALVTGESRPRGMGLYSRAYYCRPTDLHSAVDLIVKAGHLPNIEWVEPGEELQVAIPWHGTEYQDLWRDEPPSPTTNERPGVRVHVGDYVLATKFDDGGPCDHFCVGFVTGFTWRHRFLVADNDGMQQRANGFRRAERITEDEGRQLVEMMPEIGDRPGPSLWEHLDRIRSAALKSTEPSED